MPGSRSVVLLALASVLVLMLGAAAWCGGPVTSRAPGTGYQPGIPPTPMGGEAGPGNLNLSGSLGSGTVNGSHGGSPWVEFNDLGMKSDIVYGARVRLEPQLFRIGLGVNADFLHTDLSGSQSSYSGDYSDAFYVTGNSLDTKLHLTLVSVTADIGLAQSFLNGRGITIAPRVGWTQYIDQFKVENTTLGTSHSRHTSVAMFTVGLAGRVCLKTLAGGGNMPGPMGSVAPVITAAAMIGDARAMRYYEWEVFLGIFSTNMAGAFEGLPVSLPSTMVVPNLGLEVGWVRYDFMQKNQREGLVAGVYSRDGNARYKIDIPTVRAVLSF